MKRLVLLLVATGCVDKIDARWSLDHDHVVAARATPAGVAAGEVARLDALVARAGAATTIAGPSIAAAPLAPPELQGMVTRDPDGWKVYAPPDAVLAGTRPALGLEPGAPVPIEVVMTFERPSGDPFYVKKTVVLGSHVDNPAMPALEFDGAPAAQTLELPRDRDVYVAIGTLARAQSAPESLSFGARVNWLASCGDVFQDDVATAYLHAKDACDGELVAVVRNPDGGVAWQVWPLIVR